MIEQIDSIDDSRLDPYRDLKRKQTEVEDSLFIAEGEFLVRRLMESDLTADSILITPRRLETFKPVVSDDTIIYVAPEEAISSLVGFHFHRGVIACGHRKPFVTLDEALADVRPDSTFVICPQVSDTENFGGIMRAAAAFGVSALIIGPESCDPFLRRCVRVSMGAVFNLPIMQSANLNRDIKRLKDQYAMDLIATVIDRDAESLSQTKRSEYPTAIVVGIESTGLDDDFVQLCSRTVTIPMHHGTDSLNVASATAVFLYHFTQS